MATPAAAPADRPWFYDIPLDVIVEWSKDLYRDDPVSLVKLANAMPEIWLSDKFDIAKIDIYHQVRANTPPPPGPMLGEQLIGARNVVGSATDNALHEYFLAEIEALDLVQNNSQGLPNNMKRELDDHLNGLFQLGLMSHAGGITNVRYLIHHRNFYTSGSLATTIDSRNIEALNDILSYWNGRISHLQQNLFFPDFEVPVPLKNKLRTSSPLTRCVHLRFIKGIQRLLNMGVSTSNVNSALWDELANELERDYNLYSTGAMELDQFMTTYYYRTPGWKSAEDKARTIQDEIPALITVIRNRSPPPSPSPSS
ncbi:hypothetical protein GGR53DRAFT_525106 [Hypoxylon sp. FL1150]|nr:hypothetical protein GGR53DRAFT_525106 [Hypoxylon sp. FL1150]